MFEVRGSQQGRTWTCPGPGSSPGPGPGRGLGPGSGPAPGLGPEGQTVGFIYILPACNNHHLHRWGL